MTEEKKDIITMDTPVTGESGGPELVEAVEEAEELMKFPMDFPIEVMGNNTPSFPQTVADIARAHFEDFDEKTIEVRYSRTRKYMSVTVTVVARSREQLDSVYRAFHACPEVKFVY